MTIFVPYISGKRYPFYCIPNLDTKHSYIFKLQIMDSFQYMKIRLTKTEVISYVLATQCWSNDNDTRKQKYY